MLKRVSECLVALDFGHRVRDVRIPENRRRNGFIHSDEIRHTRRRVSSVLLPSDQRKACGGCLDRIGFPHKTQRWNFDRKFNMRFGASAIEFKLLLHITELHPLRGRFPRNAHIHELPWTRRCTIGEIWLIDDEEILYFDACGIAGFIERTAFIGEKHRPKEPRRRDRRMEVMDARAAARIGRDRRPLEESQSKMQKCAGSLGAIRCDILAAHQTDVGRRASESQPIAVAVGAHSTKIITASQVTAEMKNQRRFLARGGNLAVACITIEPRDGKRVGRSINDLAGR